MAQPTDGVVATGIEGVALDRPELRLAADFNASPLWTRDGNIEVEDLPLSPRLTAELHRWADDFNGTTPKGSSNQERGLRPE